MEKVNFNNAGLQQLLQQLYALPNAALSEEAAFIQNDFKLWLTLHFNFSAAQLTYLEQMNNNFTQIIANDCNYFVANRLPINLNEPLLNLNTNFREEDRGKLFRSSKTTANSYSAQMGNNQVETLNLSIEYLNQLSS